MNPDHTAPLRAVGPYWLEYRLAKPQEVMMTNVMIGGKRGKFVHASETWPLT